MALYQHVLLIGSVQGIMLTLALWVRNWGKQRQNPYFLFLVGIISLTLLAKYGFSVEGFRKFPHLWFLTDLAAFAIGPLWYLTLMKSTQVRIHLSQQAYWLLTPTLFQIGFQIYLFSLPAEQALAVIQAPWYASYFYLFCLGVFVVNGGFLLKAHRLIRTYREVQFPPLLRQGQYALLGVLAVWLLSFLASFVIGQAYTINIAIYSLAFLSFAFLTFGLAFLALVKPTSFYFLTQTFDSGEVYVLQEIAQHIQRHLQEERPYLQPGFSLNDLSAQVKANPVLTSKAINRILKTTYSDLMNEQRVRHFLYLAKQERYHAYTLWAIAEEAGFGNKVTFYKSFKKVTGSTPKAYLEAQKANDPS